MYLNITDALESFEAHSRNPGARSEPQRPTDTPPLSSSSSQQSKPKFDPLHAGKRKPAPPSTSKKQGTKVAPISDEDNLDGDKDVVALTEGLGKLLEELANNSGVDSRNHTNEDTLAATLAALAAQNTGADSSRAASDGQPPPEDIFAQLFAAAAAGGGGSSTTSVKHSMDNVEDSSSDPQLTSFLDSLMHQLLSKEVLYQPMKDIAAKYPEWLAANGDKLSDDDKARYIKQQQCIKELCDIYENDPTNYPLLMDVLQTMQTCGNPPDEIVEELAPGMKFGGEGGGLGLGGIPADLSSADCCIQ